MFCESRIAIIRREDNLIHDLRKRLLMRLKRNSLSIATLAIILSTATVSDAIVIIPSGSDNSSAPLDDPGWLNVGNRGVYIGNRWVLTVAHVGPGSTTFPSVGTFSVEPGTATTLVNPPGLGLTIHTDLVLYRLSADPGLPNLSIASSAPTASTPITMMGDGRIRSGDVVEWDVVMNAPDDWTWTEVASDGDFTGYKTSGSGKRWGSNQIEETVAENGTLADVNTGYGDVISFTTAFDTVNTFTLDEAQAQTGDSGGAVFAKNTAGSWVLNGVIHAVGGFPGQPPSNMTAIDGNTTYIADLSAYRSQVVSVTGVPEPNSNVILLGLAVGLALFRPRFSRGGRA